MYPIFKFVSLAIRLFSRPAIELMKKIHNNRVSADSWISYLLIKLGNVQYKIKVRLDKKLMNIRTDDDMFLAGLKPEVAREKGIHFFYETLFYTVVIGAATWEGYHIAQTNKEINKNNKMKLIRISADLDKLIEAAEELIHENEVKQEGLSKNLESTSQLLENVMHHTEGILNRERKLHDFVAQATLSQERILEDLKEIQMKKS